MSPLNPVRDARGRRIDPFPPCPISLAKDHACGLDPDQPAGNTMPARHARSGGPAARDDRAAAPCPAPVSAAPRPDGWTFAAPGRTGHLVAQGARDDVDEIASKQEQLRGRHRRRQREPERHHGGADHLRCSRRPTSPARGVGNASAWSSTARRARASTCRTAPCAAARCCSRCTRTTQGRCWGWTSRARDAGAGHRGVIGSASTLRAPRTR